MEREFTEHIFNFKYVLQADLQKLRVGHNDSIFVSLLDAVFYFYVTVELKTMTQISNINFSASY